MIKEHIILAALWILYGILHSVLADTSVKRWFSGWMGKVFIHYRLFYTLFALVTFIGIIGYQVSIYSPYLILPTLLIRVLGAVITAIGLGIMLFCIRKYFMSLSGLKSLIQPENNKAELMISDIHKLVRHPLYLGTFTFIWGLWLLFPTLSLLIANFIITVYTLIGIRFEEKKLVELFGENYTRYQQSVPKILPFKRVNP